MGGKGERTGRRIVVLCPEVGMLEEGQVWSGWSACVGGAFELSQRRCQTATLFIVNMYWVVNKA